MDKLLAEYKSISDSVKELSKIVGESLINDAKNQQKKFSKQTNVFFVENTIELNTNGLLNNVEKIAVNYVMYLTKTRELYDNLTTNHNSEADDENYSIRIVSGFINGKVAYDFHEIIYHELEHLFQYACGMKKRKSLYDKTVDLIMSSKEENNLNRYFVGLCSYYCFKHEQDAFAHQFYSKLKLDNSLTDFNETFKRSHYWNFCKAIKFVKQNQNNKEVLDAINFLGYTKGSFLKLISYRKKRFLTKFKNVYNRFIEENRPKNESLVISLIKRNNLIFEDSGKCGQNIKLGIESFFNF